MIYVVVAKWFVRFFVAPPKHGSILAFYNDFIAFFA